MTSILSLRPLSSLPTEKAVMLAIGSLATAITYLQRGRMPHEHPVMGMIDAVRAALLAYDGKPTTAPTVTGSETQTFEVKTEDKPLVKMAEKTSTGNDITDRDERFLAELARRVRMSRKDCLSFIGKGGADTLARLEGTGKIAHTVGRKGGYRLTTPKGWDFIEGGGSPAEVDAPRYEVTATPVWEDANDPFATVDEVKETAPVVAMAKPTVEKVKAAAPIPMITEPELIAELDKDDATRKAMREEKADHLTALRAEAKTLGIKGHALPKIKAETLERKIAEAKASKPTAPVVEKVKEPAPQEVKPTAPAAPAVETRPTLAEAVATVKAGSLSGCSTTDLLRELGSRIDAMTDSARARGHYLELRALLAAKKNK